MAGTWRAKADTFGQRKRPVDIRMVAIAALVVILVAILSITYVGVSLINTLEGFAHAKAGPLPRSVISVLLTDRDLLSYNSVNQYMPYVLVGYTSYNVTNINVNASLYKYTPPTAIYILNDSNECFGCGNTQAIENAMYSQLTRYGIIKSQSDISTISPSQLLTLPNDSLLIVLNGLLPATFFANVSTNITVMDELLIRHMSILYVGQGFNNVLLPDSVVTPASNMPGYLYTVPVSGVPQYKNSGFYFNKPTFEFPIRNGTVYSGYLAYTNVYNGSVAAFPNTPSSWPNSNETGADVAKAVQEMFWLPKYAYGTRTVKTANTRNSTGQIGLVMNATPLAYNSELAATADKYGAIRIVISANGVYPAGDSNSTYQYILSKPLLYDNGTLGMYSAITTNQTVPLTFSIVTHSNTPVNIQPHLSIYSINQTQIFTTPLPFIHNVSNNFTFLLPYERLVLPPGKGYIIKLHSFYGTEYAGAFFNVSPIVLYLVNYNITADKFYFSVTSNRQQVNNLVYTMKLNGQYPVRGIIKNGSILYSVPPGTPTIHGTLNFTLNISGSTFYYHAVYNPLPFVINQQYIEVIIVSILIIVMVIFVRAPYRDEFYIDVPNLPEEKRTQIKLKASSLVGVFDSLNSSYHWKYMPLSRNEIRAAISRQIRYNNFPVSLTYGNVERILDQLTVNKYLVAADGLYAPSEWLASSKHDIEYLATFKKLRLFLVAHAYIFTDLDASQSSDIVATLRSERKYIVIYSRTSKFRKVPIFEGSKTYIAFLNSYRLEEFKNKIFGSTTSESEELKMYIAADYIRLVDADNPEGLLN